MKTAPMGLKKLKDAVSKEVVRNTKCNKLNMKIKNLENNILHETTNSSLETTIVPNKKVGEVEKKIRHWKIQKNKPRGLATTTILNTKIGKVGNKNPDHAKYITSPEYTKFVAKIFNQKSSQ